MKDRKKHQEIETRDKCNICGWEGPSDDVIYEDATDSWHCPACHSEDMDDINTDQYDEDEDEDDDNSFWWMS